MLKGLNELSKKIHKNNCEKGFYDKKRELGTILMLVVSEVSEALEADRKGRYADLKAYIECQKANDIHASDMPAYLVSSFRDLMKDTFEDEIADTFIRLFDLCGHMNIDIEAHIKHKIEFNKKREHMHGKAY